MSVSVNPGFCASELRRNVIEGNRFLAFLEWLMVKLVGFTGEEGSRQLVYAAVGGEDLNGQYISMSKITDPCDLAIGDDGRILQEEYWVSIMCLSIKYRLTWIYRRSSFLSWVRWMIKFPISPPNI